MNEAHLHGNLHHNKLLDYEVPGMLYTGALCFHSDWRNNGPLPEIDNHTEK
jgi:hypothetical protein